MLSHKKSLKIKYIEIIQSIFSNHNRIKLEINNEKYLEHSIYLEIV